MANLDHIEVGTLNNRILISDIVLKLWLKSFTFDMDCMIFLLHKSQSQKTFIVGKRVRDSKASMIS